MSKRRNGRELALKVLFQIDVGRLPVEEALANSFEEVRPSDEVREYVDATVRAVVAEQKELDEIIDEMAVGWRVDRLAHVDKNVLRLALYELRHPSDTPASLVVNDAVEIAKKYSTDDSGRFVNGILGSYQRRREQDARGGTADEPETERGIEPEIE